MLLVIDRICKDYTTAAGLSILALSDISLTIAEREFVCLLGPSGCGKTTLLRVISGLEHPSSGEILLNGVPVRGPSPRMMMIFQEYSLYPWRTVRDNVSFGLEVKGLPKEERLKRADHYLALIGLSTFAKSYPYELSGGMRQRVAVARALAVDPAVLLMDEPFGALDAQTRNYMQLEILEIWKKTDKIVLFVTHSVDEAVFLADRVVVMTARPGQVREIVEINLPRPRNRTSTEFADLRRHVLALIEEEQALIDEEQAALGIRKA